MGRLAMNVRESDVEKFLRGYGKVRDISLKRGYGFVVRKYEFLAVCVNSTVLFRFVVNVFKGNFYLYRSLMITEMLTTLLQI